MARLCMRETALRVDNLPPSPYIVVVKDKSAATRRDYSNGCILGASGRYTPWLRFLDWFSELRQQASL